jgi:RimJ/RimL family protein N-acetyltransferase
MYKCLKQQTFVSGNYSLVPIRMDDRYDIMHWRNEQIYHLRQKDPLTEVQQDKYFDEVVSKLFDQEKPEQILFSFLEDKKLIGYGGLVHIDWENENAEISLVLDTQLEKKAFNELWKKYLTLVKKIAFNELKICKIYTYAFDLRPKLYSVLLDVGFKEEARLVNQCRFENGYLDVVIHSFWNPLFFISYRPIQIADKITLFNWVNDIQVRDNSKNNNAIKFDEHTKWFEKRINSEQCKVLIFLALDIPIGQVRLEKENDVWLLDYSVDANYRGLSVGFYMIKIVVEKFNAKIKAVVKKDNQASAKIFQKLNFILVDTSNDYLTFLSTTK